MSHPKDPLGFTITIWTLIAVGWCLLIHEILLCRPQPNW